MAVDPQKTNVQNTDTRPEVFSKRRHFLTDINTIIMCLAVCCITMAANYLSFQYYYRHDMSGKSNISDKMVNLLKTLPTDVDVYCLWERGVGLDNDVRDLEVELLQYTNRLKFHYLDSNIERTQTDAVLTKHNLSTSMNLPRLLFVKGDKSRLFNYSDMVSRLIGGPVFKGEDIFYEGITRVLSTRVTKVYFVSGHEELNILRSSKYLRTFQDAFRSEGWDHDTINLAQLDAVPADCSLLVIAGPGKQGSKPYQFSRHELTIIDDYLTHKGRLFVMLDPLLIYGKHKKTDGSVREELFYGDSGLEGLLGKWGINIKLPGSNGHGVILDKGLPVNPSQWQTFFTTEFPTHPVNRTFQGTSYAFVVSTARAVHPIKVEGLESKIVYQSSIRSFYERKAHKQGLMKEPLDFANLHYRETHRTPAKTGEYMEKSFPFAASSEKKDGTGELTSTRVLVIGTSRILDKDIVSQYKGNWRPVIVACKWLLQDKKKIKEVVVDVGNVVTLTEENEETMLRWFIAVPIMSLLLGMCIWWIRRS